eukprot:12434-Heterococcus_DN1.PRE.3
MNQMQQQPAKGVYDEKPVSDGGKSRREGEETKSAALNALSFAGRAYTALQTALSRNPSENLTEASHQVVLRAKARVEAAALQLKIMQHLAMPGYIKLESTNMADMVFDHVATRYQQRLENYSTRSLYNTAAQTVLHLFKDNISFGQQLQSTCVNVVFLALKVCRVADAVPQDAHKDWPYEQSMKDKSTDMWRAVQRHGRRQVASVARQLGQCGSEQSRFGDRYTADDEGELHFRVHFYTCSTNHRRVWRVQMPLIASV